MTSIRSHRLSCITTEFIDPFIVRWSRLLPTILFSIVFLPSPTLASIHRDVDSGNHYFAMVAAPQYMLQRMVLVLDLMAMDLHCLCKKVYGLQSVEIQVATSGP